MIQVIIVDDDTQCRQEIRAVLEHSGECIVVGESTTPTEVMADSTVGIIILTQFPDEERLFQFLKVGANAYTMRTISPEELLETVRRVSAGEFLFSFYSS